MCDIAIQIIGANQGKLSEGHCILSKVQERPV